MATDDMTKDELVAEADKRGVDHSGTKADIIDRLEAADANPASKGYPAPATPQTAMGTPSGSVVNTPDRSTDVYANIPGGTRPEDR